MADPLYLSLWFQDFESEKMLDFVAAALRQFPFSEKAKGVIDVSVQPLNWGEASIYENSFVPPASVEDVVEDVSQFVADDCAITFGAWWDLWTPPGYSAENVLGTAAEFGAESAGDDWVLTPLRVEFLVQGREFDEGVYAELGHVQINFGLEYPFVQEGELDALTEKKVQANIATLAEFSRRIELSCELAGRTLWSESESNLAQKLVARLQGMH